MNEIITKQGELQEQIQYGWDLDRKAVNCYGCPKFTFWRSKNRSFVWRRERRVALAKLLYQTQIFY